MQPEIEREQSLTGEVPKIERLQDRVEELEEEKAALEETVQSLAGDVNSFNGTATGALDNDVADQLGEVFNLMARQKRLNQMVFNIDSDPFDPEDVPSEEDIQATKAAVRNAVLADSSSGASSESSKE